jgi:hypothetical protein
MTAARLIRSARRGRGEAPRRCPAVALSSSTAARQARCSGAGCGLRPDRRSWHCPGSARPCWRDRKAHLCRSDGQQLGGSRTSQGHARPARVVDLAARGRRASVGHDGVWSRLVDRRRDCDGLRQRGGAHIVSRQAEPEYVFGARGALRRPSAFRAGHEVRRGGRGEAQSAAWTASVGHSRTFPLKPEGIN